MAKRSIYIWKLKPVLNAEGGVNRMVSKARTAKLSVLWIKVAEGSSAYSQNIDGATGEKLRSLISKCHESGIEVWGWHVPRCPSADAAEGEAKNFGRLVTDIGMDGLIMDAEGGEGFFQGGAGVAAKYAQEMKRQKELTGKPIAISSHDIPQNISGWLPKFNSIAAVADFNFPQVYYGGSPSVDHRLTRAEDGNNHLDIPFIPVGAAWIGDGGGCASASACAERAREFMRLIKERGYEGCSFWHWSGAPLAFWEVLNTTSVS